MFFPLAYTLLATALLPGVACQNIDQLFTVDPSCNPYNLNQVLSEVRILLGAANGAISNLQRSSTFLTQATRNYMRNAANTFGTQYYRKRTVGGLMDDDKTTLNTVNGNYMMIQALLAGETVNGRTLTAAGAYITCADTYTSTNQAIDIDENQPPGTTTEMAYRKSYLFYVPGHKINGREKYVQSPTGSFRSQGDPLCYRDPKAAAEYDGSVLAHTTVPTVFPATDQPVIQLILCPTLFESARGWRPSINVSPPSAVDKNQWKFLAGILLHELFHVVNNNFRDRNFYAQGDSRSFLVSGGRAAYAVSHERAADGRVITTTDGVVRTTDQPDAYRLFAEECQFSKTTWSVSGLGA